MININMLEYIRNILKLPKVFTITYMIPPASAFVTYNLLN